MDQIYILSLTEGEGTAVDGWRQVTLCGGCAVTSLSFERIDLGRENLASVCSGKLDGHKVFRESMILKQQHVVCQNVLRTTGITAQKPVRGHERSGLSTLFL